MTVTVLGVRFLGEFPLPFLCKIERTRGEYKDNGYGTKTWDYSQAVPVEIEGFIHELTDAATGSEPHLKGNELGAVFTSVYGTDVQKGDLLKDCDGNKWLVDELINTEVNPFTGWQPTIEARLSAWRG